MYEYDVAAQCQTFLWWQIEELHTDDPLLINFARHEPGTQFVWQDIF